MLMKVLTKILQMDEVGITEYVKGDNRKFEIWYAGKEEVYIVQVGHWNIILETTTCIKTQESEFANKNNVGHILIISSHSFHLGHLKRI